MTAPACITVFRSEPSVHCPNFVHIAGFSTDGMPEFAGCEPVIMRISRDYISESAWSSLVRQFLMQPLGSHTSCVYHSLVECSLQRNPQLKNHGGLYCYVENDCFGGQPRTHGGCARLHAVTRSYRINGKASLTTGPDFDLQQALKAHRPLYSRQDQSTILHSRMISGDRVVIQACHEDSEEGN